MDWYNFFGWISVWFWEIFSWDLDRYKGEENIFII